MNEWEIWIWLVVGLVPYHVKKAYLSGGKSTLEVRALFWSLRMLRRRSGRTDWSVRIPLVERLRETIWAVVAQFRGDEPAES